MTLLHVISGLSTPIKIVATLRQLTHFSGHANFRAAYISTTIAKDPRFDFQAEKIRWNVANVKLYFYEAV